MKCCDAERIPLYPGSAIYVPGWLESPDAAAVQRACLDSLDWTSPILKIFGRSHPIPRRHAFVGDTGVSYRWSGIVQHAQPWVPALSDVRARLAELGLPFNSLLANHYRGGSDSMGWHADDESELGPLPVIATISLGQARKLRFKPKAGGDAVGFLLEHGSLLLTSGEVQQYWVHQVAKSRASMIDRISLTFRYIGSESPPFL
ncbi:alpha-ketoglutarate-dependent dioxygenase AlkB family protein [Microbulbifer aggregans]|uniref:alpha-ketoglutarate-dependent dioxygenase AlkB family protein n=1 Tax=Microbulbifer aggregans TaxID=1769779 RepID=UPI001CFD3D02|nr:alpha-ketoglutarate-dependent dioxygenase AlkB [Microbulbifer aggregans]